MKRDLVSFSRWTHEELSGVLDLATLMKREPSSRSSILSGKTAALIFEHESLRTRLSFEVGVAQLGGYPIFLQQEMIGLATRESVHDIATMLSRYNQLIVARTARHQTIVQLAESATVPVINAMTDLVHPCQILADILTLMEADAFSANTKIVFVGAGNNIVNSWLEAAEKIAMHLVIAVPPGHEPHPAILEQSRTAAVSRIEVTEDVAAAVRGANAIYTDVWPELPNGDETARLLLFRPYQVNPSLLDLAGPECVVMHRLPARRGEEITREVLDGPRCIAITQAENRLHVQKAIIAFLLQSGG